jgi:Ca-activated chloride channel homolog
MSKQFVAVLFVALATSFFSPIAFAQRDAIPLPPGWRAPTIRVNDTAASPVVIRNVEIESQIVGRDVRTRIELRIANPNARVLEGELQFPLLDGQVVNGFALDIDGHLREAVAIPKARGQEIFEDIRRRNVDPALLEATAGNQYKLRVYPIPPRGERRVVLVVTEQLAIANGRVQWRFPTSYGSDVERISVRVEMIGAKSGDVAIRRAPRDARVRDAAAGALLEFASQGTASGVAANALLELDLAVKAQERMLVGETNSKRYFATTVPFIDEPVRRSDPKHIALVWDASGSAKAQRNAIPVLDEFFKQLRLPTTVTLLVMRNQLDRVESFTVAPGSWDGLKKRLRDEPFDGSSNFDDLPIPAQTDLAIFVSDGLATDGARAIGYAHSAPLIALNTAVSADSARLKRLAERTGGRFVDATSASANVAAAQMWRDGWRIEAIESNSAEKLVASSAIVSDNQFQIAGIMGASDAVVSLRLRHPSKAQRMINVNVVDRALPGSKRASLSNWPGQLWATWQIAALADEPHINASAMTRIASEHGIVSPTSSLIVLETAQDYARYDVPAPDELREAVARLQTQKQRSEQSTQAEHIERMVREFDVRQRWWDRSFPKGARSVAVEKKEIQSGAIGVTQDRRAVSAEPAANAADADFARSRAGSPPAMAAPAAAPAPAREASGALDKAKSVAANGAVNATIALKAWTPDAPYLRRLRDASEQDLYRVYLDLRDEYASSSSFYLDVASHFFERKQQVLAMRILSNLAEMNLENRQLLRLYGYRLNEAKQFARAASVFARVRDLAPNEPQSWRDLGLAHADAGEMQKAADMLWETVSRPWDRRFAGINMIALAELNALIAKSKSIDAKRIDARLIRNMPLGLRVVMAWDTDDTDIDLWVIDPNGERSAYDNRLSFQGAAMSPDATGGCGPEEFALRDPKPGKYAIHAQFYGHRQQVVSNGTTVMVRVTTGFATPNAKDEWMTLRLTKGRETVRIGDVEVR